MKIRLMNACKLEMQLESCSACQATTNYKTPLPRAPGGGGKNNYALQQPTSVQQFEFPLAGKETV